MVITEL